MIGSTGSVGANLSSAYSTTSRSLSEALTRIASGKKFQNPSEDLLGYIRSQKIQRDLNEYDRVRQSLTEFKTFSAAAVDVGSNVYGKLVEMKDLATKYAAAVTAADTEKQALYNSEFNALETEVASLLTNGKVDNKSIVATGSAIASAIIDPNGTSISMQFSSNTTSAGVTAFNLTTGTTAANVQTEIDKVLTYMSEAKAFNGIADQQMKLADTIVNSKKAVMSMITDIDDAEESNRAIDLSIRQQAAISMMAQGNIVQKSLLKLYE